MKFEEYIGVVARTHGLDGTMLLDDTVGIPRPLTPGVSVGIGFSREFVRPYTVDVFEQSPTRTTLRLREITTPEQAEALRDHAVYAAADTVGLSEANRFRVGDIEGCSVITTDGIALGTITDVWLLPANDVWVVTRPDGSTVPLPVIDEVVIAVNTAERSVTVNLLPGLLDIDTPTETDPDA